MSFKDTKEGETHFVCAKHSREDGEEAECCGCTRVSTQCSFVPDDYNPMSNQPIEEKWKEEFDKMRHAKGPFIVSSEAVKAFIENLLEQERMKKGLEDFVILREEMDKEKKRMSDEVKNRLLPLANVNEVEKVDDAIKYMGRLRRSDIIAETIGKMRAYQSALSIINK